MALIPRWWITFSNLPGVKVVLDAGKMLFKGVGEEVLGKETLRRLGLGQEGGSKGSDGSGKGLEDQVGHGKQEIMATVLAVLGADRTPDDIQYWNDLIDQFPDPRERKAFQDHLIAVADEGKRREIISGLMSLPLDRAVKFIRDSGMVEVSVAIASEELIRKISRAVGEYIKARVTTAWPRIQERAPEIATDLSSKATEGRAQLNEDARGWLERQAEASRRRIEERRNRS